MHYRIRKFLMDHWLPTFLIMGMLAALLGLSSLNLFVVLNANIELITRHGIVALRDGAFRQLLELICYGYASLFFYLLFKACEKLLVTRITG
jgi:hypothetical protein